MTPSDQPLAADTGQPLRYPLSREYAEPDWNRLPGFHGVSAADWESAVWQRRHTIKNLAELKAALGNLLPDDLVMQVVDETLMRSQSSSAAAALVSGVSAA